MEESVLITLRQEALFEAYFVFLKILMQLESELQQKEVPFQTASSHHIYTSRISPTLPMVVTATWSTGLFQTSDQPSDAGTRFAVCPQQTCQSISLMVCNCQMVYPSNRQKALSPYASTDFLIRQSSVRSARHRNVSSASEG